MPNDNLCEIIVVLDRSGSMSSVKHDMEGGFKQYVEDQKKVPGECRMTLVQFDSQSIDTVHEAKSIHEIHGMELSPRGATPLLDAVGKTINLVGDRLKRTDESKRPGKVIFVVITDGYENASHEFTQPQIKKMVEDQTNIYKWHFVYLGANVDAFAQGGMLGVGAGNIAAYAATGHGTRASYNNLSSNTASVRGGHSSTMGWTDEQRDDMVDKEKTTGGS